MFIWIGKDFYREIVSKEVVSRSIRGDAQASEILKKKAMSGDVYSMFNLGVCYMRGTCANVEKDARMAIEIWKKISDRVPEAAFNVGLAYERKMVENGKGEKDNIAVAMSFYRMAASESLVNAEYRLAGLLEDTDPIEAFQLYSSAVQKDNNPLIAYRLGWMYFGGKGVEKNTTEATRWFKKAAENGRIADAMFMIGYIHLLNTAGAMSSSDRILVAQWFILAAENDKRYIEKTKTFLTKLDKGELETARKMAATWTATHLNIVTQNAYDDFIWTTAQRTTSPPALFSKEK